MLSAVLALLLLTALAARFWRRQLREVALQLGLGLTLCLFSTAQPVLMEFAKVRNHGSAPFHTPSMVFYTESFKLVVALVVYGMQLPKLEYTGLEGLKPSSLLAFAVPALLYALSNNLNYYALQLIDPPTYQLWGCAKLVFAGVFFRVLLGRRLTLRKWLALCLLATGMAMTTVRSSDASASDDGGRTSSRLRGIGLVLCTSALSGLSGCFNEWLIKFQDPKAPLMLKNVLLYGFGALMCFPGWKPTAPLGDPTLFVTLVVVQALTGLCVSFVLKYCDSLVKGFSTSGGVLVATILSCVLFGFELRTAFVVGFAVVVGAFYAYFM